MTEQAPEHLSRDMKAFWKQVHHDYDLDAEHARILQVACEQFDRAQAAREQIAVDGMVLEGHRHPLIGVEAKSTELFLRGIRDLGLQEAADHATR